MVSLHLHGRVGLLLQLLLQGRVALLHFGDQLSVRSRRLGRRKSRSSVGGSGELCKALARGRLQQLVVVAHLTVATTGMAISSSSTTTPTATIAA